MYFLLQEKVSNTPESGMGMKRRKACFKKKASNLSQVHAKLSRDKSEEANVISIFYSVTKFNTISRINSSDLKSQIFSFPM